MKVLIFEYITGGGMVGETLSASLVKEGELMLAAVANDFNAMNEVSVSVLRDFRLQSKTQNFQEIIVSPEFNFERAIEQIADKIDAMLIIAPETDNILFNLCSKYSQNKFILLNSDPNSIALAADKYDTYLFLQKHMIKQVPTYLYDHACKIKSSKIIAKPKDGVGCENIMLIDRIDNLNDQKIEKNYIFQPYISGHSYSLSLLCWEGECSILSVNKQFIVENNDALILKHCVVNELAQCQFISFANKLSSAFKGLKGYIGVDLIIDNEEIYLVEINPRLTTSYVGIHSALGFNPAQLLLRTFLDKKLPDFKQKDNSSSVIVNVGDLCAA